MPTGYTDSISKGISFEKFTLNCARAFGALIMMRDEPSDAPFPTEVKPSDYNAKALKKATHRLRELETMKKPAIQAQCEREYQESLKYFAESEKKDAELRVKYDLMLSKVKKWTPPTPDHQGLKDFMIEQIETSIKYDCDHKREKPVKPTPSAWLLEHKRLSIRDIAYHTKGNNEEIARCADRTKWIQALLKSLGE